MTDVPTAKHLPRDLLKYDQWVCWQTEQRDGKQTKIPIDPSTGRYASTTDPETWATFEQARDHTQNSKTVAGIGFVFTDGDPLVGVDLDNCRDDEGQAAEWAIDVIDRLDSYTELSPSGTGYHVILTGTLPEGANRRGDLECYETSRYFTVTGESIHNPPRPVNERTDALASVHAEYIAEEMETRKREMQRTVPSSQQHGETLDDETVLTKARNAANGTKFERLWNGSTSGYESHSEADMALCFQLSFWTGGDTAQIDRLFRQSGLMREKWDEVHFADGSTYGEKTVERAVTRVDDFYDPTETRSEEDAPEPRHPPQSRVERPTRTGTRSAGTTDTQPTDQRVQELMSIIDRLEARVSELEAENERLHEELNATGRGSDSHEGPSPDGESQSRSVWTRMTARLGTNRRE